MNEFNIEDFCLSKEEIEIMNEKIKNWKPKNRYCSKTNRYKILARQGWRCKYCGCKLKYDGKKNFNGKVAHIDHIIPWKKRDTYEGNINELSNLQALCPSCNLKKHSKDGF